MITRILNAISLPISASILVVFLASPLCSTPDQDSDHITLKNGVISWKPDYDIKSGIIAWIRNSEEKIRISPSSEKNELWKIVIALTADILNEIEYVATNDKENILRWLDLHVVHALPLLYKQGECREELQGVYEFFTYELFTSVSIDLCYIREKIEIKKNSIKGPLSLWHRLMSYFYRSHEPIVTLGSIYKRVDIKGSSQEKAKILHTWFDAQRKKIRKERLDDILTWVKKSTENVKHLQGKNQKQALEAIQLIEEILSNENVINHKEKIRQENIWDIIIWIKNSRRKIKHVPVLDKEEKDQALETIRAIEKILEELLEESYDYDDAMWDDIINDDIINKDITNLNENEKMIISSVIRNKQQELELKKAAEKERDQIGSLPEYKEKETDHYTNPFANGTHYVIISWLHSIITHIDLSPENKELVTHGTSCTPTYFVSLLRLLNEALKRTEDIPHSKFSMELPSLPITVRSWDRIIVDESDILIWPNSRARSYDNFSINLDLNGIKKQLGNIEVLRSN
jgi:hypothetical protein